MKRTLCLLLAAIMALALVGFAEILLLSQPKHTTGEKYGRRINLYW